MAATLLAVGAKSVAGPDSAVGRTVDRAPSLKTNLSDTERLLSAGIAGGLLALGPSRGLLGLFGKVAAGGLLFRAATGHCMGYRLLGDGTGAETVIPAGSGSKVEAAATVGKPPAEVYAFWRNYANLPKFMDHVAEVRDLGNGKSHWVVKGPLGVSLTWDAELVTDTSGEVIAWKSLPGADVDTTGSVHFRQAPGGRGTEVRVSMKYDPPAGKVSRVIATLLGQNPTRTVRRDLARLKELLEAGERPTVEGQSHGVR